jgi:hypothetical protein
LIDPSWWLSWQNANSPLIADTGSSTRSQQVRAAANVPKNKRGDAISVIEVDVENALSADLTFVAWNDRSDWECATSDYPTGDLNVVIRQSRHSRSDADRTPKEVGAHPEATLEPPIMAVL